MALKSEFHWCRHKHFYTPEECKAIEWGARSDWDEQCKLVDNDREHLEACRHFLSEHRPGSTALLNLVLSYREHHKQTRDDYETVYFYSGR